MKSTLTRNKHKLQLTIGTTEMSDQPESKHKTIYIDPPYSFIQGTLMINAINIRSNQIIPAHVATPIPAGK